MLRSFFVLADASARIVYENVPALRLSELLESREVTGRSQT
jgi:hypothetical protein